MNRPGNLEPQICRLQLPLALPQDRGWQRYPFCKGSTANMRSFSAHASVLAPGNSPHPPHTHPEEELLLVLQGQVELHLPAFSGCGDDTSRRLNAGEFVYYPAGFPHTLTTVSEQPADYLMFRWVAGPFACPHDPLGFERFQFCAGKGEAPVGEGFRTRLLLEGPTAYLRKLHCHASTLSSGAGYEPHEDNHDVAVVVLEGELSTLGGVAKPCDVILCPSGRPHGMRNKGKNGAQYLVFEFHGTYATARRAAPDARSSRDRAATPGGWKQRLLRWLRRQG